VRTTRFVGLMLVLASAVVGCGSPPAPTPEEAPLTVEQWKAMPVSEKYEVETFERLKAGSPKLQSQKEWDKFTREVILPAKKKDLAGGKP
jgi:hypothetical protein